MTGSVLKALAALREVDPTPLAQGLSPANARICLDEACDTLSRGLADAQDAWVNPPRSAALVCSHGVFTSPLEWMALYAAKGVPLHVKASARDPRFVECLALLFQKEGLAVTCSTDRALPRVEALLAFGDDATIDELNEDLATGVRFRGYGHKFSVAVVRDDGPEVARLLALDIARYDTRGCFAPAAIFTLGDPARLSSNLVDAMADAEARWPRGAVDPALGPEWRRRSGLARVRGTAHEAPAWSVLTMPVEHFTPVALPRMAVVHGVSDLAALQPYRAWLSSCATDDPALELSQLFPRVCLPGELQRPAFPRLHDGLPMTM